MFTTKMSHTERQAVISLSAITSLRMIGLFMVLPVFSLYATHLSGATPFLIGMAMGVYGLSQAIFQIPFGALSDRLGRKPIITLGLLIFMGGSLIAGFAHSIGLMIAGRALQGIGAVGSTLLAMVADLTREDQRTKAMAIMGISIGLSFTLAMVLGPVLTKWLPINTLFLLAALCGVIGIVLLYTLVPTPPVETWHKDTEPKMTSFIKLFFSPELAILNVGIFILHAIFTASFVVIPMSLLHFLNFASQQQWQIYLPTLVVALIIALYCIGKAERTKLVKPYFLAGIIMLILAEDCLWWIPHGTVFAAVGLCLFFAGFSLLEAFLPSLISRTAPPECKGSAMGIYSCSQFSGIFIGGMLGGYLYGKFSFSGVYFFCIMLTLFWLVLASFMQPPIQSNHKVN